MKELMYAAAEGFVGSFVLAVAIVAAVSGGAWRVTHRLYSAFAHDQPLPVAPGKTINLP